FSIRTGQRADKCNPGATRAAGDNLFVTKSLTPAAANDCEQARTQRTPSRQQLSHPPSPKAPKSVTSGSRKMSGNEVRAAIGRRSGPPAQLALPALQHAGVDTPASSGRSANANLPNTYV